MRILILIAVACLLVVLGGQIYCFFTLDKAEEEALSQGSISGRLDCGEYRNRCCAQGPAFFLDYPAEGAAAGKRQANCGEFFNFDGVKPGRHSLYVEFRLAENMPEVAVREVATVDIEPGEHISVGTVLLPLKPGEGGE